MFFYYTAVPITMTLTTVALWRPFAEPAMIISAGVILMVVFLASCRSLQRGMVWKNRLKVTAIHARAQPLPRATPLQSKRLAKAKAALRPVQHHLAARS